MTQKTIKALYKQPVNYKLIRDGYKTIDGVINARDGMPKVLELDTPSITYNSDLQYDVDNTKNGAPILNFNSFTLPDDETCEAKQYCYAPKDTIYNYKIEGEVEYKQLDATRYTIYGNPSINTNTGIISNFSSADNLNTLAVTFSNKLEIYAKIYCTIHNSKFWLSSSSGQNGIGTDGSGYMRFYNGNNYSNGYFNLNTWYWVYFIQENSRSSLYYLVDNNYDVENLPDVSLWSIGPSISSNMFSSSQGFKIGTNTSYSNEYWSGSVDLFNFLIKCDDSITYKPYITETKIEEITVPILGILDSSVITDDWQQNQEYKLYQLKDQSNLNVLQLTENNITNSYEKYKQYIQQVTIPARDYKWYYNGIPQEIYPEYYCYGTATVTDGVISGFGENSFVRMSVYPHSYEPDYAFTVIVPFETGDSVTNNALLQIINWGYDPELQTYTEKSIYFSCIHNGKFSITNDQSLQTFEEGIQLSPNTKYWTAIYIRYDKIETYIISDNNYQYDNLPSLQNWTKEYTINFINEIEVYNNMFMFGQYEDMTHNSISYGFFNGKLYIDECFGATGLSINYSDLMWEPYYYYDNVYNWYANKSLYDYTKNQNYADTLDFSNSWVNVTSNWKTQKQYTEPNVCLMPIDGGETITTYQLNATEIGNISFNTHTGIVSGFNSNNYLQLQNPFNPGENSWEITFKIKTDNDISTYQDLIGNYGASYQNSPQISISNSNFRIMIPTNPISSGKICDISGSYTVLPNTVYYIKLYFTGTAYCLDYSTDGETWVNDISFASTTTIGAASQGFIIGFNYWGSSASDYFYGIIDLSESCIKINNQIWWSGASVESIENNKYLIPIEEQIDFISGCLYNYNDDGSAHDFDVYYDSQYTQPILVSSGQSYANGTKVDTITIPAHDTWTYTAGGNWTFAGPIPSTLYYYGYWDQDTSSAISYYCDTLIHTTGTYTMYDSSFNRWTGVVTWCEYEEDPTNPWYHIWIYNQETETVSTGKDMWRDTTLDIIS